MTTNLFLRLPVWAFRLFWSFITLLLSYLVGQLIMRTICRRLSRLALQTSWKWDDVIVETLRRGIPVWSVLIGCHVVLGFWQMPEPMRQVLAKTLLAFLWCSVTFIAAGLASRLIILYRKFASAANFLTSQ